MDNDSFFQFLQTSLLQLTNKPGTSLIKCLSNFHKLPSEMEKRKLFVGAIIVGTVLLSSFSLYIYQILYTPNLLVDQDDRFLYIPTGVTFTDIQKHIYDNHYVNDPVSFSFIARLMKYDRNIKPGKYLIKGNSTNVTVIRMLRAGEQIPVNITFSNVRLLKDLPEIICGNLELKPTAFGNLILDPETSSQNGFTSETFPCMFIPNTYEVYWNITAKQLLDRMNQEYDRFWNESRRNKAKEIDLSPVEVSTLASIVQAESRHYDESPVIAGLYLNRLKKGIPLQADPTVVFAVGDFTIQRVLNKHIIIDSPYNTYKHAGLPPGPINFPSIKSIDAVLNYKSHRYLYMCAKEDFSGYHNFAKTLREHNNNARRYRQALNKAGLYK